MSSKKTGRAKLLTVPFEDPLSSDMLQDWRQSIFLLKFWKTYYFVGVEDARREKEAMRSHAEEEISTKLG